MQALVLALQGHIAMNFYFYYVKLQNFAMYIFKTVLQNSNFPYKNYLYNAVLVCKY